MFLQWATGKIPASNRMLVSNGFNGINVAILLVRFHAEIFSQVYHRNLVTMHYDVVMDVIQKNLPGVIDGTYFTLFCWLNWLKHLHVINYVICNHFSQCYYIAWLLDTQTCARADLTRTDLEWKHTFAISLCYPDMFCLGIKQSIAVKQMNSTNIYELREDGAPVWKSILCPPIANEHGLILFCCNTFFGLELHLHHVMVSLVA